MPNSSRRSASAVWITASNSFERWLISMTDIPVPLKSSSSAWACSNTSSGSVAGPGLKLNTRFVFAIEDLLIEYERDFTCKFASELAKCADFHAIISFCQTIGQEQLAPFAPDVCR